MSKRFVSPVSWTGGKYLAAINENLPLFPPHSVYVEVFGGGGQVLFLKTPAPVEVYNDIDAGLVHFFRTIQSDELFCAFYHRLYMAPFSHGLYRRYREEWETLENGRDRARAWFFVLRLSFQSAFGRAWCYSRISDKHSNPRSDRNWYRKLRELPRVRERLRNVRIENRHFREILARYDTEETLFYLDPPYVPETCTKGLYRHEMTMKEHRELTERLLTLKGMAILSGNPHPVYAPLERAGWTRIDVIIQTKQWLRDTRPFAHLEPQHRIDSLWVSPTVVARHGGQLPHSLSNRSSAGSKWSYGDERDYSMSSLSMNSSTGTASTSRIGSKTSPSIRDREVGLPS